MKFISWNVNGLRACVQKGFQDFFDQIDADFFCLQETKLQEGQINLQLPGYQQYWNYAQKKGYSGTAIFTKEEPIFFVLWKVHLYLSFLKLGLLKAYHIRIFFFHEFLKTAF